MESNEGWSFDGWDGKNVFWSFRAGSPHRSVAVWIFIRAQPRRSSMMLGYDVISHFVVQVDYEHQQSHF